MDILNLPATIHLVRGADNQQLQCSSERKISSTPVLKQDMQKTGKCFTVIRKLYSKYNDLDWNFSVKSYENWVKKSFKVTILTVFLSLQRVALWCRVGMKVYRNIYWRIIKVTSANIPATAPAIR